jgi:hypothetical protein
MFLDESECEKSVSGQFCAGRDTKLNTYEFEWYNAHDLLTFENSPESFFTGTMAESIENFSF